MSEYRYLYCGRVVTPLDELRNVLLELRNGLIGQITPDAEPPTESDCLDLSDRLVVPGFVDVHVHGGDGFDVADGSLEGLHRISAFLAAHGVTSFVPAIVASPWPQVVKAMQAIKQAVDGGVPGARVLGAHLEGPFLNAEYKGAQPEESLRAPSVTEFEECLHDYLSYIRIVTLAPESPGSADLIDYLVQRGVTVSAGHTAATYDEMLTAVGIGIRSATHLFNAMRQFHHREPGIVGAVLIDDRVFAELIWDNLHVHPAAASLVIRAKGTSRVMLVSDAMRAAGLADGDYELGGQSVRVRDGVACLSDGTIAGSITALDQAVRNASVYVGLRAAVEMASLTPAVALGLANRLGSIQVGLTADLTVLDRDLNVAGTIVSGRPI